MKKNLTISMDANLLEKVEKIAIERNTTVTIFVRNLLKQLIETEQRKSQTAAELESLFEASQAQVGTHKWSRDELHER